MAKLLFLILLSLSGFLAGQTPVPVPVAFPYRPNKVFGPGERFEYGVHYGFLNGGFALFEVLDTTRIGGALCHQVRAIAHSNSTLSIFFPVRDTNTSYIDVNGLFSHKIAKVIREGSYKRFRTTVFDPASGLARTQDFTVNKDSTIKVIPFVHDIISSFYYFRTLNVADSVDINCMDDYKSYPLRVRIIDREKVKTVLGKFKCIVIEPNLASSGIFLKKGKMTVWLTDDERHLPVMVKFKLPFLGNITCELEGYRPATIIEQTPEPALLSPEVQPPAAVPVIPDSSNKPVTP